MNRLPYLLAIVALALAGTAGFLASGAIGQEAPTRTVTVDVGTGPQGPPGPAGPKGDPGPAGAFTCLVGYSPGILLINHAGGHVRVYTCLED